MLTSDRPKFGSVPVPATISTGTEIPVPVSDIFKISDPGGNSVQNATENVYYKALALLRCYHFDKNNFNGFYFKLNVKLEN